MQQTVNTYLQLRLLIGKRIRGSWSKVKWRGKVKKDLKKHIDSHRESELYYIQMAVLHSTLTVTLPLLWGKVKNNTHFEEPHRA